MKLCDVLIIGAGATGLMAAYNLAGAGKNVVVLEARNRLGGRIHTLSNESFFEHAELGAEFIHGDLPVTFELLKTAGIPIEPAEGEMWHFANGEFQTGEDTMPGWDELMDRLNSLKDDCSIENFLQLEFAGPNHAQLRRAVRQFAAGYDTADPQQASAFALRNEWEHEGDNEQYRVKGGYCSMINFLADACKGFGGKIYLNSSVTQIQHTPGKVQVSTADGEIYHAAQIIVALPLGVLQAAEGDETVRFAPPLPQHNAAFNDIGFGAIIKILLEFNAPFWEDEQIAVLTGKDAKTMGFLISEEDVPTWWAQYPKRTSVLTGWLGGPAAAALKQAGPDELLEMALQSLANIFKTENATLRDKLVAFNCVNWTADKFTRGSYAYDKVASPEARKLLARPVNQTLFFAGEYLYNGPAMGTVEAALTSGQQAAEQVMAL